MNNPYWDEIKDRLDEVTDGLNIGVGLPPRRLMLSQAIMGTPFSQSLLERLAVNPYDVQTLDPVAIAERYRQTLWYRRKDLCAKYCWAIPDPDTIDFLVQWAGQSVVEIGAGTGYFAWQLAQRGIPVHAYDIAPPHLCTNNDYHSPHNEQHEFTGQTREVYHSVAVGSPEVLERHAESTLLLCWPPMGDMATRCLQYYPGNRLLYIGEWDGGCTADEDFFALLAKEWREAASRDPVQWDGIHDVVYAFEREKVEA
jgi:hypothetical protein